MQKPLTKLNSSNLSHYVTKSTPFTQNIPQIGSRHDSRRHIKLAYYSPDDKLFNWQGLSIERT